MRRILRYKNRKLYDSLLKRYINLEDVVGYILKGESIRVDDKTLDREVTGFVLAEAISRSQKVQNSDRVSHALMMIIQQEMGAAVPKGSPESP